MAKVPFIFAKIDVNYADHPKIAALSDGAFRAHMEMILYARKYLTDGIIPKRFANRFGSDSLTELETNDETNPSLCKLDDGDYRIHDFLDAQESKDDVERKSQVNAANGRKGGRPPKTQSVSESQSEKKAESESESESEEVAKATSRGAKRARTIPEDFQPSDRALAWQQEHHPTVNTTDETERFINHHRAKGSKFVDHDAAWRNWIKNSVKFAAEQPRHLSAVPSQPWTPPPGSPLSYVEM